jgi:hypothetical protein
MLMKRSTLDDLLPPTPIRTTPDAEAEAEAIDRQQRIMVAIAHAWPLENMAGRVDSKDHDLLIIVLAPPFDPEGRVPTDLREVEVGRVVIGPGSISFVVPAEDEDVEPRVAKWTRPGLGWKTDAQVDMTLGYLRNLTPALAFGSQLGADAVRLAFDIEAAELEG